LFAENCFPPHRHCEERSDEAIQKLQKVVDFWIASFLAMTTRRGLLRLPAGRLVAYPTHKFSPLEVWQTIIKII
jgi:hypothetical protein